MKKKHLANDTIATIAIIITTLALIVSVLTIKILASNIVDAEIYANEESPKRYYKYADVVVTDIDARHWYASGHHWTTHITVKNEEYNISKSFNYTGSAAKEMSDLKKGDIIQAEIRSYVIESTGEIVSREICELR